MLQSTSPGYSPPCWVTEEMLKKLQELFEYTILKLLADTVEKKRLATGECRSIFYFFKSGTGLFKYVSILVSWEAICSKDHRGLHHAKNPISRLISWKILLSPGNELIFPWHVCFPL